MGKSISKATAKRTEKSGSLSGFYAGSAYINCFSVILAYLMLFTSRAGQMRTCLRLRVPDAKAF